jgi:hypothetical protein
MPILTSSLKKELKNISAYVTPKSSLLVCCRTRLELAGVYSNVYHDLQGDMFIPSAHLD